MRKFSSVHENDNVHYNMHTRTADAEHHASGETATQMSLSNMQYFHNVPPFYVQLKPKGFSFNYQRNYQEQCSPHLVQESHKSRFALVTKVSVKPWPSAFGLDPKFEFRLSKFFISFLGSRLRFRVKIQLLSPTQKQMTGLYYVSPFCLQTVGNDYAFFKQFLYHNNNKKRLSKCNHPIPFTN